MNGICLEWTVDLQILIFRRFCEEIVERGKICRFFLVPYCTSIIGPFQIYVELLTLGLWTSIGAATGQVHIWYRIFELQISDLSKYFWFKVNFLISRIFCATAKVIQSWGFRLLRALKDGVPKCSDRSLDFRKNSSLMPISCLPFGRFHVFLVFSGAILIPSWDGVLHLSSLSSAHCRVIFLLRHHICVTQPVLVDYLPFLLIRCHSLDVWVFFDLSIGSARP